MHLKIASSPSFIVGLPHVGQCLGNCINYLRCNAIYGKKMMKAPEGERTIKVVDKCDCGKLSWNPNGLYSYGKN